MSDPVGTVKDLLIVSFSYSPMLNPRAFRWTALAEEFARRGVRVRVVCSWQPGLAAIETLNGVDIHRVGNRLFERCRALLSRSKGRHVEAAPVAGKQGSALARGIGWAWRQLAWPDTTCVWHGAALREVLALLRTVPGATLVTVSPSFTAALVGAAVVRKETVKRWVVDMGDPFSLAVESPANNFMLYGALNRHTERTVFRMASAVSLTNASVALAYGQLYPAYAKKIFVIPPLLPSMLSTGKRETVALQADATIRLVYVGSLYKSLRRPDFLLALFMELTREMQHRKLELHFVGNTEECNDAFAPYASQLGLTIKRHGLLTRDAALAAIRDAAIVVNLGNANRCQLPSKLVEYMALGKPILNIVLTDADPSQELLQGYRSALNVFAAGMAPTAEQVENIAQYVERSISNGHPCRDDIRLEQFGLDAIAGQYSRLLFGEQDASV